MQQMILLLAALAFLAGVGAGGARAETVRIVSMTLGEGLMLEDGTGLYGDLLRQSLARAGVRHSVSILPMKRAIRAMNNRAADCIWPLDVPLLERLGYSGKDVFQSELLFVSTQHVFIAAGQPPISSLSDLKGKSVGILRGGSMQEALADLSVKVVPLTDQRAKIWMFLNDRLDAILGWYPDLYVTLKVLGEKPDLLSPGLPALQTTEIRLVCRKSEATERFMESLNPAIIALRESAAYLGTLKKHGVPDFDRLRR